MKKVLFALLEILLPVVAVHSQTQQDSLKSIDLQEVQVIATRATKKTPLTYSEIDKETIETVNYGRDIPFILTLTPSVVATSEAGTGIGYTGFRIRGTDANRINITANGIPMNDSESQGVFWVNLPDFASSLEDLQIQRGVGTSTNGAGAFGASINLKTENIPMNPYGEFNGGYGSFNTSKATLKLGTGKLGGHWIFDARISGINSDGYIDRAAVDLKSFFAQTGYFNEKTFIKMIVFGGKEKTYHAWDGVPESELKKGNRTYNPSGYMGEDANGNPMYYDNQTDNYLQTNYQLSWMQVLSPDLKLNLAFHYTKGDGYYEEYKQDRSLVEYGLNPFEYNGEPVESSDLIRQKHLDNGFGGGIFSLNYIKGKWDATLGTGINNYDGNHFGYVTWIKNYAGDPDFYPEHEYYRSKGKKTDFNIFTKANYQLLDFLSLYGDLQYRRIDYTINGENDKWNWNTNAMQQLDVSEKFNFFNPKAGLFFKPNIKNEAYLSFAVAHREPNRNNYTDAGFNETPRPERLYDYEAGYKFRNKTWSAGVNFYFMQYKDQLVLNGKVNEIGEPLTSNVPDSYRMGVELTAGIRLSSSLRWDGSLTLSQNKIRNFSEFVYDGALDKQIENYLGTTSIAYSPPVIAKSLLSFSSKGWNAGFESSYVGKQYLDNTGSSDRKLDPYFVNNLLLAYRFQLRGIRSVSTGIQINNIFDQEYESNGYVWGTWYEGSGAEKTRINELYYFPQAGINILANISLKF